MIRGLQVGFGHPIGAELLATLRKLGVQLVRLDCQDDTPLTTQILAAEVLEAGLVPFTIIRTAAQLEYLPAGSHVELRNEPDLNGPSPSAYEGEVHAVYRKAERLGIHLWAGCVSNLNTRGLKYLADARVDRWPTEVSVSVHWYPHGDSNLTPHPGLVSRQQEVEELKELVGRRAWGVSEFGFHTANRATSWLDRLLGRRRSWTDQQVADMVAAEWKFWEQAGATGAVLYQINDGPGASALDRYGIRRIDGTWKPVARTFNEKG